MEFDYRLALMTGVDIPIPECQLSVKQPTVKEISMMGERDFQIGAQLLCVSKEDFREQILDINSNFNLLMFILQQDEAREKKMVVKTLLEMLLPQYKVMITPRSILCKKNEENLIIDEGNFDNFQKIARRRAEANPDDSMFSRYISILAIGLHMSIEDLLNLTVFQITDLFERFSLWTQSDVDLRIRLAGGTPNDQPDN